MFWPVRPRRCKSEEAEKAERGALRAVADATREETRRKNGLESILAMVRKDSEQWES